MTRGRWWLSAEPLGDDVVWALTRVPRRRRPDGPADAGLATGLGEVRRLAESALPTGEALWSGPLAEPEREREIAVRLGTALLPPVLRHALRHADPDRPDDLTIAVRGWLARVPWDCLALDAHGDVRLVERVRVFAGLPATVQAGRARLPTPDSAGPAIRVIDPGPRSDRGRNVKLYPGGIPPAWVECCTAEEDIASLTSGRTFGREHLGERLRSGHPQRLMYFGHALPGTADAPAAAALLLATPARTADTFTAFDWLADAERYPAPPRVAIVGCGSDDGAQAEQSGLPIAAVNAGAELVTATRWIIPMCDGATALAMAVDAAHASGSPPDGLRDWQRARLAAWRRAGEPDDAPLLWASLVSYRAPGPRP